MQHEGVVTGAVVRFKDIDVRHHVLLIGHIRSGNERREEVITAAVAVGTVSVITLFVSVVRAHDPIVIKGMLESTGYMYRVWSFVVRVNEVSSNPSASSQATWTDECVCANATCKAARAGGRVRAIDTLECSGPSILREIVVIQTESGADDGLLAAAG